MLRQEGISVDPALEKENEFRRIRTMIQEFIHQKETIRISEEKFRRLSESTTAAIIIHDDKRILVANASAEKMLGYSQPELKNTDFLKIVHPDFLERYKEEISEAASEAGKIWRAESRFISHSGEEVYVDVSTVVIELDSGPVFLVTAHDITDRIRMEKELVIAKETAEKSDKIKSAFLSNLTHEIRTPMNAILGFSNLLKKKNVSREELEEYAQIIVFSTNRLLKLVEDILEISKIETEQVVLNETPFSIDLLLEEIKDQLEAQKMNTGKKEIQIDVIKSQEGQGVTVIADMDRLRQVLQNVLDNALKFTEKGTIRFGYKVIADTIKFSIEDTGIGIPLALREEIFQRFYQADADNNRMYQGSGLGLAISRALIEIMGGKIWAESEEGKGSVFHMTIPYKKEDFPSVIPDVKHYAFDFTGNTILVVEDEMINSRLLGSMVQAVYARVLYAYNGQMAVDMIKNIPEIDLVLMDIQMPGMDGYEATRIIKFWRKDIPVIAQSASAHADDLRKCYDVGCEGHISKPIDTFRLYQLLDKYLKKKGTT